MAKKTRRKTGKKRSSKKRTARRVERFNICAHDGRSVMTGGAAKLRKVSRVCRAAGIKTGSAKISGKRYLVADGNVEKLVSGIPN
jgi:hypothetical protein